MPYQITEPVEIPRLQEVLDALQADVFPRLIKDRPVHVDPARER